MKSLFVIPLLLDILLGWTPAVNLGISGADNINVQACEAAISSGSCFVWQTNFNGNWDVFSRFDQTGYWSDTVRITTSSDDDIFPNVAAGYFGSGDTYWCAWQNNGAGNWDIYVSYSNGVGVWSLPYQLTTDSHDDELPSIFVDFADDTVWVVWQHSQGGATNILSCCYDGSTWSAPITVTDDASDVRNVHPKICRSWYPVVIWERNDDIYYCEYRNGEWQVPLPLAVHSGKDCNPELTGFAGLCVMWQTDRDGNYEIYSTAVETLDVHYRLTVNDSADITPSPLTFYIPVRHVPAFAAFSTNRNGNYDIYVFPGEVPVDTNSSTDILPTVTLGSDYYLWVLWQSDRTGTWDIYGSYEIVYIGTAEEENWSTGRQGKLMVIPNPFAITTDIKFMISENIDKISLEVYDISGKEVKHFNMQSAVHNQLSTISWNGCDDNGVHLPQGVYFIRLRGRMQTCTQKVILLE